MAIQILNFNIDTLVLNVKGKPSEEIVATLNQLKEEAAEAESDLATEWEFLHQTMYIKPHGAGHQWRWILHCQDLHVDMGKGKRNGIMAKVRFSSLLLHAEGIDGALSKVYAFLVMLFGNTFVLQVSEVHRCLDITGWEMTLADSQCFVSRGRTKRARETNEAEQEDEDIDEVMFTGRRVSQFDFSKTAPHACCIYDKTKEVKQHQKEWFHEIWKANGWDGVSRVIRIEFRYARECLHEMDIEDPYEMLDQLDAMWAYSTQKWLRHCAPNGDTNMTRWPLSKIWEVVQNPGGLHEAKPKARDKKVELDTERAKAGFVGFATSWAVREVFRYQTEQETTEGERAGLPLRAVDDDGGGFLAWAFDPVKDYLIERKEATFTEVMQLKAKKLGLVLAA